MRPGSIIVLWLLLLAGCGGPGNAVTVAANLALVPVFGRTLPDLIYSGLSGRDCSMVQLEQGRSWCREAEPAPAPPPFCTRSLGTIDCWASEASQPVPARRGVADGPQRLIDSQERHRTRGWPGLLSAEPNGGDP